jgi:hypothetical protein
MSTLRVQDPGKHRKNMASQYFYPIVNGIKNPASRVRQNLHAGNFS